jgi:hypothetical protein
VESPTTPAVKRKFINFFSVCLVAVQQNLSLKKSLESERFFQVEPGTLKKNQIPLTFYSSKNPWAGLALPAKVFVRSKTSKGWAKPI